MVISENITNQQFAELVNFMSSMIGQSMNALDSHDEEHIMWYEDCSMEDYFHFDEIWDEDLLLGEGIDTIAHKFVLNDDTRSDFKIAFEEARDNAFEKMIKDIAQEVDGYEPEEDMKSIDIYDSLTEEEKGILKEQNEYVEAAGDEGEITYTTDMFIAEHINEELNKLEQRGYKKIAFDSDITYDFYINDYLCSKLIEEGCSVEKIAEWLGATVVVFYHGSEDYQKIWFK